MPQSDNWDFRMLRCLRNTVLHYYNSMKKKMYEMEIEQGGAQQQDKSIDAFGFKF